MLLVKTYRMSVIRDAVSDVMHDREFVNAHKRKKVRVDIIVDPFDLL